MMDRIFEPHAEYGNSIVDIDLLETDEELASLIKDAESVLPSGTKYDIYRTKEKVVVSPYPSDPLAYVYYWRYPNAVNLHKCVILREGIVCSKQQ